MPHGRHIYAKEYDIPQATMCAYTQYDHAPPHWKFLLRCCTELLWYVSWSGRLIHGQLAKHRNTYFQFGSA